jgi:hypothetical protein
MKKVQNEFDPSIVFQKLFVTFVTMEEDLSKGHDSKRLFATFFDVLKQFTGIDSAVLLLLSQNKNSPIAKLGAGEDFFNKKSTPIKSLTLHWNNEKFGELIIYQLLPQKTALDKNDLQFLTLLTEQFVVIIKTALLYEDLQKTLKQQEKISNWHEASDSEDLSKLPSLKKRTPDIFLKIQKNYELLLDDYLESIGFDQAPPHQKIQAIAQAVGEQGGSPNDVITIHLKAVEAKCVNAPISRARAYTMEGRLLAIELMGHLVDFYRLRK